MNSSKNRREYFLLKQYLRDFQNFEFWESFVFQQQEEIEGWFKIDNIKQINIRIRTWDKYIINPF